jgi:hypothetical protein
MWNAIDVFVSFKEIVRQIQLGFPPVQETLFRSYLHINYASILGFHKIREVTLHPFITCLRNILYHGDLVSKYSRPQ